MEQLMQVLAAADSTVREGFNAQVQALANKRAAMEAEWAQVTADRARVDEGRHAVDSLVETGRKMHHARLAAIQAREDTLDSIMRETEEERQAALIGSSTLEEALGKSEDALEAERKTLDERTRSAQEFEATIRRWIEVLDLNQCEQEGRGRAQAQRAQELEERAQALEERARVLDQCEATLATHEATAAGTESALCLREEAAAERTRTTTAAGTESALCLREEAAAERTRTTTAAEAAVTHRVEELRLQQGVWRERDATLAEREAEVNRREVAACRLGDQLTKREEAVVGRAAMAVRASELEARENELAPRGQPGDTDLASQLTTAQDTLADLGRLVQD
ncbi:uncharacterized protein LOC127752706 [Oryza glaberrima]|uniref:uncharacterized protein LOC127752706 n=1 Tax=Oryza glaberrima TaxID=4538 RepID=UPI00224C586F|nr:uncharacterized protein LOC127752706 [Oryza glaberrima]